MSHNLSLLEIQDLMLEARLLGYDTEIKVSAEMFDEICKIHENGTLHIYDDGLRYWIYNYKVCIVVIHETSFKSD